MKKKKSDLDTKYKQTYAGGYMLTNIYTGAVYCDINTISGKLINYKIYPTETEDVKELIKRLNNEEPGWEVVPVGITFL